MTALLLALVFAGSSLTTFVVLAPAPESSLVKRRVHAIRRTPSGHLPAGALVDEEMAESFGHRVIGPIMERFSGWVLRNTPSRMRASMQSKLVMAGNPMSASRFMGMQALFTAGMGLFALLLVSGSIGKNPAMGVLFLSIFLVLGWRLPDFWLSRLVTARRQAIDKALPDVLDLLSVSVEAGLGLDGAVQKVGEKFPEPIAGEFRELLKQIRLGTPRAEALRALAERSGLPDMRTFTAAVIQAEQLGVSIGRVLRGQSEALRVRRKQKIEEKAMALPVKILFPLVLFIFPTIFIVVLGPAVITLMKGFFH